MALSVAFLFHFNQSLTAYAKVADRACYSGLLKVLRAHPETKFSIHISGTLIESLKQFGKESLALIQSGVRDGQFEILGSTYAQNVMAATDDLSNRLQIEQHLDTIWKFFRVRPEGFWNSERCWKQEFVKLISDFGYRYTLVERQTLEKSGAKNIYAAHKTFYRKSFLTILNDDEHFKHKVNLAVWAGANGSEFGPALEHLDAIDQDPEAARALVVYAEDAEASGLWGYHHGAHPQAVWRNWDLLLRTIRDNRKMRICSIADFLRRQKSAEKIARIPDGQAVWMVASLRTQGAPYHEDGYRDWFDFSRRAPKLKKYRPFFQRLARKIRETEEKFLLFRKRNGSDRKTIFLIRDLLRQSKLIFCAHQYEFGCIGIGKKSYRPFQDAKKCLLPLRQMESLMKSPARSKGGGAENSSPWAEEISTLPSQKPHCGWIQESAKTRWTAFKKRSAKNNLWFKNYIAASVWNTLPEEVVEYRREPPRL